MAVRAGIRQKGWSVVGDVIWAPFPFTTLSSWKFRPVVVVADVREMREADWLVCEITTSPIPYANAIPIGRSDMQSGHLPRESRVRPNRMTTLNESAFGDYIGRLTGAKLSEIHAAVRNLF